MERIDGSDIKDLNSFMKTGLYYFRIKFFQGGKLDYIVWVSENTYNFNDSASFKIYIYSNMYILVNDITTTIQIPMNNFNWYIKSGNYFQVYCPTNKNIKCTVNYTEQYLTIPPSPPSKNWVKICLFFIFNCSNIGVSI